MINKIRKLFIKIINYFAKLLHLFIMKFKKLSLNKKISYVILLFVLVFAIIIGYPTLCRLLSNTDSNVIYWDGSVSNSYAGGNGTISNPYQISNGSEFAYFLESYNSNTKYYYEITNDIYLNDASFSSNNGSTIKYVRNGSELNYTGSGLNNINSLSNHSLNGYLDGNSHHIYGLLIYDNSTNGNGSYLFNKVDSGSTITDLYIQNAYIYSLNGNTGLINDIKSSTIESLIFSGHIIGKNNSALIQNSESININKISTKGFVEAINASGIIINDTDSLITNSYNGAKITSTNNASGIVLNSSHTIFNKVFNYGSIKGSKYVGGLISVDNSINDNVATNIIKSFNIGSISLNESSNGYKGAIYSTCLKSSCHINSSLTFYSNVSINSNDNQNAYNNMTLVTVKNSLNDYSWSEIKVLGDALANNTLTYASLVSKYNIEIGDTKEATINNENHTFRLIDTNHDVDINGNILGMTFEQVDLMNNNYVMKSTMTNSDSYGNSDLLTTINNFTIDSDLNSVITESSKSSISSVSNSTLTNVTSKLWIISETEINGTQNQSLSLSIEGSIYAYYSTNNTASSKIKQKNNVNNNYWLRSANGYNTTSSFAYINDSGIIGSEDANNSNTGISICFCIGEISTLIIPVKENLEDYSWSEIKVLGDALANNTITYSNLSSIYNIEVGDTKGATINGEYHQFRLIDTNHDVDNNGNPLGMTFEQVDLMDAYKMSSSMSNSDSWENSELRQTINNFSSQGSLINLISYAKKPYASSVSSNTIAYSNDKFWIMSQKEIANSNTYTIGYANEGTPYKYYTDLSYSQGSRIKQRNGINTTYRLRSANSWSGSYSYFARISELGEIGSTKSNNDVNIAICFCIGSTDTTSFTIKSSLSSYTWEEIKILADSLANGYISYTELQNIYHISIGDTKTATINNTSYTFRLVDVLHDADANDQILGMTFEQVDLMNTTAIVGDGISNQYSWKTSKIKTTINNYTIDSSLSDLITPAKKAYINGLNTTTPVVSYTTSKLWIMSETEIANSQTKSYNGLVEGTPYKYYTDLNYSLGSRIKNKNGTATAYWLRTPSQQLSFEYARVIADGNIHSTASSNSYGVSVCFCIGNVTNDFNIVNFNASYNNNLNNKTNLLNTFGFDEYNSETLSGTWIIDSQSYPYLYFDDKTSPTVTLSVEASQTCNNNETCTNTFTYNSINNNIAEESVLSPVLFSVNATDNSDILKILYYINTSNTLTALNPENIDSWNIYNNNVSISTLGYHTIYIKVIDVNYNVTYVCSDMFTYNNIEDEYTLSVTSYDDNEDLSTYDNQITKNTMVKLNFSKTLAVSSLYDNNDIYKIVFSSNIPSGTKIYLIDNIKIKTYVYTFDSASNNVLLSSFNEIGKDTIIYYSNKPIDYNSNGTQNENFDVILDFSNSDLSSNLSVDVGLQVYDNIENEALSSINNEYNNTIKVINIDSNNEDVNSGLSFTSSFNGTINLSSTNTITIPVTSNSVLSTINEYNIYDSGRIDKDYYLDIYITDENNNIINGNFVNSLVFNMDSTNYYTKSNGHVIIPWNYSSNNESKNITLTPSYVVNTLQNGTYYLRIKSYCTNCSSLQNNTSVINLPISVNNSSSDIDVNYSVNMSNNDRIFIKSSNTTLNNSNNVSFNITYDNNELNEPKVLVSLYRKYNYSAYNLQYELIDLASLINTNLTSSTISYKYILISNLSQNNNVSISFKCNSFSLGGYKLVFDLYDGSTYIKSIEKTIIVK